VDEFRTAVIEMSLTIEGGCVNTEDFSESGRVYLELADAHGRST
jgi:hypothetical protein